MQEQRTGIEEGPQKRRAAVEVFKTDGVDKTMKAWALELAGVCSQRQQLAFFRVYLNAVRTDIPLLKKILDYAGRALIGRKYLSLDRYIESMLTNDYALTPRRIAYELRRYKRIDHRMRPLAINIARRVKNRLRARKRRAEGGQ
jgi:hypothetical protein